MAAVTPRFHYSNSAALLTNIVTASSEDGAAPVQFSLDQLRSKAYKSGIGWVIVEGYNDKIDINESTTGDATATLTAGTYATGALMAAEITTALNAAATDNTYSVAYSASTFKFTITRATGSTTWALEWSTGTNTATSAGLDLGFVVATDDTGLTTSIEADNVSYQSRHWITIEGAATIAAKVAVVLDHNLSAAGTVTLHGNASDAWTSPSFTQLLDDSDTDDTFRSKFFTEETLQFYRFEFADVQNSVGFLSVGLVSLGDYLEPTIAHLVELNKSRDELTQSIEADQGAGYANVKPGADIWSLEWVITEAERSSWQSLLKDRKVGRPFMFWFDPLNDAGDADYLKFVFPPTLDKIPTSHWRVDTSMKQALG